MRCCSHAQTTTTSWFTCYVGICFALPSTILVLEWSADASPSIFITPGGWHRLSMLSASLEGAACCCQLVSALPKLSLMTRIRRCAICVTKSIPFTCCTGIFDLTQPCHRARFVSSDKRQHPYPIRLCALKPGWPSGWGYIFWADLWSAQPGHIGANAPGQRDGQLSIIDPESTLYESRWAQHVELWVP